MMTVTVEWDVMHKINKHELTILTNCGDLFQVDISYGLTVDVQYQFKHAKKFNF